MIEFLDIAIDALFLSDLAFMDSRKSRNIAFATVGGVIIGGTILSIYFDQKHKNDHPTPQPAHR